MFEKLTNDNIVMFAIKHYDNPQCEGESEFHDDMKRFKYIKRLLRKYNESGELKERLILNHMIVVYNLFGAEAGSTLLLFKIEPELWSVLKTFMVFLNMILEDEMEEVEEVQSNEQPHVKQELGQVLYKTKRLCDRLIDEIQPPSTQSPAESNHFKRAVKKNDGRPQRQEDHDVTSQLQV